MSNKSFLVDLKSNDLQEFISNVKEYALIRWNMPLEISEPKTKVRRKYIDIESVCAHYFKVPLSRLFARGEGGRLKRDVNAVKTRHFICYLMWIQGYTTVEIRHKLFSGDRHAVSYAINMMRKKVITDVNTRNDLRRICKLLKIDHVPGILDDIPTGGECDVPQPVSENE
jgi:hypothetical protein